MTKLIGKFNGLCTKMYVSAKAKTANEKGASTVEWLGLAFVMLTLMAVIAAALDSQGDGIASSITKKIGELIDKVGE